MSIPWREIKRRNVIRVGIAYVIGAWLLLQVADVLVGLLGLPDWTLRLIGLMLLLGLPLVVGGAWVFEVTPDGIRRAEAVDPTQSITNETGNRLNLLTFVFAIGLAGFFLIDRFVLERHGAPAKETPHTAAPAQSTDGTPAAPPDQRISIAVLPFVNMSSDPENSYFSDGISEELLNVLSRLPQLKVAARTSSFQYKGRDLNVADIGNELGVAHLLEGSVRKAGDRVRITAQLIQTSDGFHLWSQTYDRELKDIFAVQSEIAKQISSALRLNLLTDDQSRMAAGYTGNLQAYDLYLLGRYYFARRSQAELEQALVYFQQAIDTDPTFALAWVGLADTIIFLQDSVATYGTLSYAEVKSRALPAIEKALALEPDLANAHASLGLLLSNGPDPWDSLEHFEKAIALNPNSALAQMWYGQELMNHNRFSDATVALRAAAELDPLTPVVLANSILPLMATGDRAGAEDVLNDLIALAPDSAYGYTYLSFVQYQWGDLRLAAESAARSTDIQSLGLSATLRGVIFLALGRIDAAREWLVGENQGLVLAATGDWDALVAFETRRLETTSFRADVLVSLAQGEIQRGNLERAASHFQMPGVEPTAAREALYPSYGILHWSSFPALDLAYLHRQLGQTQLAEAQLARCGAFLDELAAAGADMPSLDYVRAGYLALSGDLAGALDNLEQAIDRGWRVPWLLRIDLNLAALHETARFDQLLRRVEREAQAQNTNGYLEK